MKTLLLLLISITAFGQVDFVHKSKGVPFGYAIANTGQPDVIISLHGFGEAGNGTTDLHKVLRNELGRMLQSGKLPAQATFVLPQTGGKYFSPKALIAFICFLKTKYCGQNFYIIGYSGGAISIYQYLAAYPDGGDVSAAVAICGFGSPKKAGAVTVPLWALHGDADNTVKPAGSIGFVKAYNAVEKPEQAILTIYEGKGHNVWDITFKNPDIYTWLLAHKKR